MMDKYFDLVLTAENGQSASLAATMVAETGEFAQALFNAIPRSLWEKVRLPFHTAVGAMLNEDYSPHVMEINTNIGNTPFEELTRKTVLITTNHSNTCPAGIEGYGIVSGTSAGPTEFIAAFQEGSGISNRCSGCHTNLTVIGAFTPLGE